MDVAQLTFIANEFIDEGDPLYKGRLLVWAMGRYAQAKGLLFAIEKSWKEGVVEIEQADEIALLALQERLRISYGKLRNGKGRSNPSVQKEFQDVVENSIEEIGRLFQSVD